MKQEKSKKILTAEAGVNNIISDTNYIKLGELIVSSPHLPIESLAGLALNMLKEKEVREYLELVKKKNRIGDYLG